MVRGCVALCFALSLAMAARAGGDASKDDAARLFDEGRALMQQGRYQEACARLERSYALVRGVGAQYNLARCLVELGRLASAHRHFVEVAEVARRAGQSDRERVARERARALEPRLSWLRIEVAARPAGLSIRYDGKEVPQSQWSTDVAVDPGNHVVVARAPRHRAWEARLRVAGEAQRAVVRVPPLVRHDRQAPVRTETDEPEAEGRGQGLLVSGIVIGSAGVVAFGVTVGLAVAALGEERSADIYCDDSGCDALGLAHVDRAQDLADAATGTLLTGVVLAGLGAALLIAGLVSDDEVALLSPAGIGARF